MSACLCRRSRSSCIFKQEHKNRFIIKPFTSEEFTQELQLFKLCTAGADYLSNRLLIQLFQESLSEKNEHMTILKGNIGYDQYIVPNDRSFVSFL